MLNKKDKLLEDFMNKSQQRKAYFEIMNSIFETLSDEDMEEYLSEEVMMQDIIEKQEKTDNDEESISYMDQYYDIVINSKFKDIRKKIMSIEKDYFDNNVFNLIKKYNTD